MDNSKAISQILYFIWSIIYTQNYGIMFYMQGEIVCIISEFII